jgi:hypothetical protein
MFVLLVVAVPASQAQVFYLYPGAPVVKDAEPAMGASLGIGEDIFRLLGYTRFNINEVTDFGLELIFDHFSSDVPGGDDAWRVGAGADVKYAIVPQNTSLPFDLAVNAGLGFESGGDLTNINIPLGGLISRPLELSNGKVVVPYGGVYILIAHYSWDVDIPGFDADETDTDVEIRTGARLELKEKTSVFATLHFGAGTMFYLGLNLAL